MNYLATKFDGIKLDFRAQATLGLGLAALLLVTPFSIYNFLAGRFILGCGTLAVVLLLAVNAWSVGRGKYWPGLNFFGLVPVTIIVVAFVIYKQGIIGVLWSYPAVLGYYCILPEQKARIANVVLLLVTLPMSWFSVDAEIAYRVGATLVAVSIFSAMFVRIISIQQHKLEELIVTDPLTGLFNRTLLKSSLEQASQQSFRSGTPMTILAMDLDHFKVINDTLGHDAGDRVLQGVGKLLQERLRRTDTVFRIGGEEFLVLLFNVDGQQSMLVAENLRTAISSHPLLLSKPVTVSIGMATLEPGEEWTAWTKRADQNLYQAKADGRNRVVG